MADEIGLHHIWLDKNGKAYDLPNHVAFAAKYNAEHNPNKNEDSYPFMYRSGFARVSIDRYGIHVDRGPLERTYLKLTSAQKDWLIEKSIEMGFNGDFNGPLGRKVGESFKLSELIDREFVKEAPIDTLQTIGDFSKGHSFTSKADRALVTHPTAVRKIRDFFKNTDVTFDFYFVNTKEARHFTEVGKVNEQFLWEKLKIKPSDLQNGTINRDAITVFFTNNKGDEKIAMTPWIIAHRFGHVIRREHHYKELCKEMDTFLQNVLMCYGYDIKNSKYSGYGNDNNSREFQNFRMAEKQLCNILGTFKSARDKNLRNTAEFTHELLAQYLMLGEIKLNPAPDHLPTGKVAWGNRETRRGNKEEAQEFIDMMERDFGYYAEAALGSIIGDIFVM